MGSIEILVYCIENKISIVTKSPKSHDPEFFGKILSQNSFLFEKMFDVLYSMGIFTAGVEEKFETEALKICFERKKFVLLKKLVEKGFCGFREYE